MDCVVSHVSINYLSLSLFATAAARFAGSAIPSRSPGAYAPGSMLSPRFAGSQAPACFASSKTIEVVATI